MDSAYIGYLARFLLVLLRIGLGRMVVLGSGRKFVLHALAYRYGFASQSGRDGKTRLLQDLDGAACDHHVQPVTFGYVLGSLGHSHVRARLCDRPRTRYLHSGVPDRCDRSVVPAFCLARSDGGPRRQLLHGEPRVASSRQQCAARCGDGRCLARYALSALLGCAQCRQDFRWSSLL